MALVAVDSLETGMVLAGDVLDRNGRMLLGAGVELTQKHLAIFRTWGVTEVNIVGGDSDDDNESLPSEVDPEVLAAAQERLLPLFVLAGTDHPVMHELLRLAAIKKVLHGIC